MIKNHESLEKQLNQLIKDYHALSSQLIKDKQAFAKNKLEQVDEHNIQKTLYLNKIEHTQQTLKTELCLSDEAALIPSLEQEIKQAPLIQQNKILKLITSLKATIKECNQQMIINRQIINANLAHLRDIVSAVNANHKREYMVYDKNAIQEKSEASY